MSEDGPFSMMNALWFQPDGGREKYMEYIKAADPIVSKYGTSASAQYLPQHALIGEFDADLVFFVNWPNFAAFLEFTQDPEYKKVQHLREEAITKSLLIRCATL